VCGVCVGSAGVCVCVVCVCEVCVGSVWGVRLCVGCVGCVWGVCVGVWCVWGVCGCGVCVRCVWGVCGERGCVWGACGVFVGCVWINISRVGCSLVLIHALEGDVPPERKVGPVEKLLPGETGVPAWWWDCRGWARGGEQVVTKGMPPLPIGLHW
jgi:hypothetical protein